MKKLIVTEESLERAMKAIKNYHGWTIPENEMLAAFDVLFVPEDEAQQEPKPQIGPGTRLRAANGDELLVIRGSYGDWGIVNLNRNKFGDSNYAEGWWSPDNLKKQLEAAGATVIEEEG